MSFIIRWIVTAIAVGAAVWLVPGIEAIGAREAWVAVAVVGLILSLVNMGVKPIVQFFSLPITCLTLGIFYLVVNTVMLYLAAWITTSLFELGIFIESFDSALVASIVISIVSGIANAIVGSDA